VHSTGDPTLPQERQAMSWPIYKNRDMSRLQNWDQWLGFFARPSASQDWAGVIDRAHQEGLVRVFPRLIAQGSKGFAMGWRHPIGAGEWTNDDSYYAELHGGLAPTFWDSVSIGAHQAIEWEETWYPLTGLTRFNTVTSEAAFFVEHAGTDLNGRLDVIAYSTRPREQARLAAYWLGRCDVVLDVTSTLMMPGTVLTISHDVQVPFAELGVTFSSGDELLAQYNLFNDGQPPAVYVGGLPAYVLDPDIPVNVLGTDPDCVRSFDVQVRDGWDGQWTTWLTATVAGTHWYPGQDGHTYYFRARARDLPGNQGAYTTNPFGDAFTSVLLTPAPILDTSIKGVDSPLILWSPIGWSIDLWNSGNLSTTAMLTDTLPPYTSILTDAIWLNGDSAPQLYVDGQIRWSGIVTDSEHIYITYHLSPTLPLTPGTMLTNTAVIAYDDRLITRTAHTMQPYPVFLPLILRNAP
jgi:hypothetical protein